VIEAITHDAGNDAQRALFCALLSGPKPCGDLKRGARKSRGSEENPTVTPKEATEVNHEEFAQRAERRLKEVADRLEVEGEDLRIAGGASKITARAQELRVAALLVREEALAVSKTMAPPAEEPAAMVYNAPLGARAWARSDGPNSAGR
jgi:hypothetical protein